MVFIGSDFALHNRIKNATLIETSGTNVDNNIRAVDATLWDTCKKTNERIEMREKKKVPFIFTVLRFQKI